MCEDKHGQEVEMNRAWMDWSVLEIKLRESCWDDLFNQRKKRKRKGGKEKVSYMNVQVKIVLEIQSSVWNTV